MTHYKIGFHTSPGGNRDGIGDHWLQLDAEGIPATVISVDNYGVCHELSEIARNSGVPHTIVFRFNSAIPGFNPDVPLYDLSPEEAAHIWWGTVWAHLPPEFLESDDRVRVWIVAGNEVDKNRADWLGWWALNVAKEANPYGFKILAYGWASGEPEYNDWTTPGQAAYLEYCSDNYDMAGLALHEYSLSQDLKNGWGYLVGRFEFVIDACAELGIRTPQMFITEFGWEYQDVPKPVDAIEQMWDAAILYDKYPELRGAMIWYLGYGFGEIADQAQKLIHPVTIESLAYGYEPGPVEPPPPPVKPPPPPIGAMIDLKDYFSPPEGDEHGRIYTLSNNWGQGPERTHLSVSPTGSPNHKYVVKNNNWERRYIGDFWIYLQADTSRNEQEFYIVKGDAWLPRFMAPGQTHMRNEMVDVYYFDQCRRALPTYGFSSEIKMLGYDETFIDLLDTPVVKLVWLIDGVPEEYYWYAKYIGLVAWENKDGDASAITEFVPTNEQPNKIEWTCSVLDEEVPKLKPPPPPPVTPPPPPIEEIQKLAWELTVEMQESGNGGIQLNHKAAMQMQMNLDNKAGLNLQKVTDEITIDGKVFMAAESLTRSVPRRIYVWEPGEPIYYFEGVR